MVLCKARLGHASSTRSPALALSVNRVAGDPTIWPDTTQEIREFESCVRGQPGVALYECGLKLSSSLPSCEGYRRGGTVQITVLAKGLEIQG